LALELNCPPSSVNRPSSFNLNRLATWALATLATAACTTPAPTTPRTVSVGSSTCKQPAYPAEAKSHQASGTTELEFEVNAEGRVTRVAIVKFSGDSQGHRILDTLALDTLNKCTFPAAPGFLPGRSRVQYVWKLQE
jgi:TonB family protein